MNFTFDNIVAIGTILLSAIALYCSLKKQGREERNIDADTIQKLYDTIGEQEERYSRLKKETLAAQETKYLKLEKESEERYCKLREEFEDYKRAMNIQFSLLVQENARLRAWAYKLVNQLEEAQIVPHDFE